MTTKITNASMAELSLTEEAEYGVFRPIFGFQLGVTGEGLSPNISTVQSEELNPNPDVMDNIVSGVDVGGDINFEVGAGTVMKLLLKHALRGAWQDVAGVPTLKASNEFHSMSLLKIFHNEIETFPFIYTGSRLNSLNFNITVDGGTITATANFVCKTEKLLPRYGIYQFSDTDDIEKSWVNPFTLFLDTLDPESNYIKYLSPTTGWTEIEANGFLLLDGIVIKSGQGIPPAPTNANEWYFDEDTGNLWQSIGLGPYSIAKASNLDGSRYLTILPHADSSLLTGTIAPTEEEGVFRDVFIITGDTATDPNAGKVYQKVNEENPSWIQIGWWKKDSGFIPFNLFYNQGIIIPKDTHTKMNIPQFKNILVTDIGEAICFTDLGFTVDNKCENVDGMCTDNEEYPHLSAVATKYGGREITGNATILFNSVTLYEDYFKKGKELGISFQMDNGQGYGWKFTFPRIKFSEGSINAEGKGSDVKIPFKWIALYDHAEGCAMIVEEIVPAP